MLFFLQNLFLVFILWVTSKNVFFCGDKKKKKIECKRRTTKSKWLNLLNVVVDLLLYEII